MQQFNLKNSKELIFFKKENNSKKKVHQYQNNKNWL